MVNSLVARSGCGQTVSRPLPGQGSWPGTSKTRIRQTWQASLTAPARAGKLAGYLKNPYPANLAGVPDGPCRGKEAGQVPQKPVLGKLKSPYPANLAGVPDGPCRGKEAGRVPQKNVLGKLKSPYPANLAGVPDAPRPRKVPKRAAEGFRGVGKHQNTPLEISEGSESVKTRR